MWPLLLLLLLLLLMGREETHWPLLYLASLWATQLLSAGCTAKKESVQAATRLRDL